MAAPKLKSIHPTDPREKEKTRALQEALKKKLEDPEFAKKAAQAIEEWLKEKK